MADDGAGGGTSTSTSRGRGTRSGRGRGRRGGRTKNDDRTIDTESSPAVANEVNDSNNNNNNNNNNTQQLTGRGGHERINRSGRGNRRGDGRGRGGGLSDGRIQSDIVRDEGEGRNDSSQGRSGRMGRGGRRLKGGGRGGRGGTTDINDTTDTHPESNSTIAVNNVIIEPTDPSKQQVQVQDQQQDTKNTTTTTESLLSSTTPNPSLHFTQYDTNNNNHHTSTNTIVEKLQAAAFRSLCYHLQERSDIVSNIDLMTLSGFCRNCLAKWMVLEARRIVDDTSSMSPNDNDVLLHTLLNSFGYNEAAEYVYGIKYDEWKKRYQGKASNEQMEKYNASMPLHSQFDSTILQTRTTTNGPTTTNNASIESSLSLSSSNQALSSPSTIITTTTTPPIVSTNRQLLSNVCCEDVDNIITTNNTIIDKNVPTHDRFVQQPATGGTNVSNNNNNNTLPTSTTGGSNNRSLDVISILQKKFGYVTNTNHHNSPTRGNNNINNNSFNINIVTVSDRAYNNQYSTGDLSGPAVQKAIIDELLPIVLTNTGTKTSTSTNSINDTTVSSSSSITIQLDIDNDNDSNGNSLVTINFTRSIVPDDTTMICNYFTTKVDNSVDLIITTGGTGMSARDITPDAIRSLNNNTTDSNTFIECTGFMDYIITQYMLRPTTNTTKINSNSTPEPYTYLSRAIAGYYNQSTFVITLPGNPKAVSDLIPVVLPLALHATII